MPVTQNYNMYTQNAYEGMVYGLRTAMTIRTVEAATDHLTSGCALLPNLDTVRGVHRAAETHANAVCYGIMVRQVNHEAAHRPSTDGDMSIPTGSIVGMLTEGEVMVKLGNDVKRDELVGYSPNDNSFVSHATNHFNNVKALRAGKRGDIVPVHIYSVPTVIANSKKK